MRSVLSSITRPLFLLAFITIGLVASGVTRPETATTVILLALMQNVAYTMQSRARLRSSDTYHAIAAIAATMAFFFSIKFLIAHRVTIDLLAPYTFATVAGNLWGKKLSERIERAIGAVANLGTPLDPKNAQRAIPLRPALLVIATLFLVQAAYHYQSGITPDPPAMAKIMVAAFGGAFLFSALNAARNTNAYWSHLVFVILHAIAGIATYDVILHATGNWSIFVPYVLGSVAGSIAGARSGKKIEAWLGSSWDAHTTAVGQLPLPYPQTVIAAAFILPQIALFGTGTFALPTAMLFFYAALQQSAFTLTSRARQRSSDRYVEWTAVFSNGVWFLTLSELVAGSLASSLYIPYITGCVIGSLWGQGIALRIERAIGSVMATSPAPKTK